MNDLHRDANSVPSHVMAAADGQDAGWRSIDVPLQLMRLALALVETEGAVSSLPACHLQAAIDSRVPATDM